MLTAIIIGIAWLLMAFLGWAICAVGGKTDRVSEALMAKSIRGQEKE